MKIGEIRALNAEELAKQLEAAHKELFDLRFRMASKQLVNHRDIQRVKGNIALFKTVTRERELKPR